MFAVFFALLERRVGVNMLNRSTFACASAVLISICAFLPGAQAAQDQFKKAVDIYLKNDFEKALPEFQALNKAQPENEDVHYYLALCYQRLHDNDKAAAEYTWILKNSKDAAFKEIIQERIKRVNHSKIDAVVTGNTSAKHDAVSKVILFSTNWCPTCRTFEPTWDKTAAKFKGSIVFEHLNAEDPSNKKSVDQYKPKAYPTLVYLDAKGRVIENKADAPMGESFATHLKQLSAVNK
jgi:thioredoxin-like negative regulator of GroEL